MTVQPANQASQPANQPTIQPITVDAKHFNQQINQRGVRLCVCVCVRADFLFTDEICNGELG